MRRRPNLSVNRPDIRNFLTLFDAYLAAGVGRRDHMLVADMLRVVASDLIERPLGEGVPASGGRNTG